MNRSARLFAVSWIALFFAGGCERGAGTGEEAAAFAMPEETTSGKVPALAGRGVHDTEDREPCLNHAPLRQPLFGDLHVHTGFSFDAAPPTASAPRLWASCNW